MRWRKMGFAGRRVIAVLVAVLVGGTPAWAEAEDQKESACVEYYRQVIQSEVSRGDSLAVLYRNGAWVRGKYWGLSETGAAVWVTEGSHLARVKTEHSLSGVFALRYRDIAGARAGTVAKWGFAGAAVGWFALLGLAGSVDGGSGWGSFGVVLALAPGVPLGAAVGMLIGASRPRSGAPSETVRCGAE